jgi:hypothetical protein
VNRPGFPEAVWFESRCHGSLFEHSVVAVFFTFGWRDVADGLQQPAMVEPVHPFERGELDGFDGPPWSTSMDELRLVKAVDGLGQRIVVAVADAADGWLYPGFCQAFSVFYGNVLASSAAVVHQSGAMDRPTFMQSLIESIEHEARVRRP